MPPRQRDREYPLILTTRFRRQWTRLPPDAQVAVGKVLAKLRHGACRIKALTAYPDLYEVRASNNLRVIVERPFAATGTVIRSVGYHGPILRRP